MTNAQIASTNPGIKIKNRKQLIKSDGTVIDITDQEPKQEEPKKDEEQA